LHRRRHENLIYAALRVIAYLIVDEVDLTLPT
jgi:hypothetical protein